MSKQNNKTNTKQVCAICGETFIGYGNNPYPIKEQGRCCDECNKLVIGERIYRRFVRGEK